MNIRLTPNALGLVFKKYISGRIMKIVTFTNEGKNKVNGSIRECPALICIDIHVEREAD